MFRGGIGRGRRLEVLDDVPAQTSPALETTASFSGISLSGVRLPGVVFTKLLAPGSPPFGVDALVCTPFGRMVIVEVKETRQSGPLVPAEHGPWRIGGEVASFVGGPMPHRQARADALQVGMALDRAGVAHPGVEWVIAVSGPTVLEAPKALGNGWVCRADQLPQLLATPSASADRMLSETVEGVCRTFGIEVPPAATLDHEGFLVDLPGQRRGPGPDAAGCTDVPERDPAQPLDARVGRRRLAAALGRRGLARHAFDAVRVFAIPVVLVVLFACYARSQGVPGAKAHAQAGPAVPVAVGAAAEEVTADVGQLKADVSVLDTDVQNAGAAVSEASRELQDARRLVASQSGCRASTSVSSALAAVSADEATLASTGADVSYLAPEAQADVDQAGADLSSLKAQLAGVRAAVPPKGTPTPAQVAAAETSATNALRFARIGVALAQDHVRSDASQLGAVAGKAGSCS